MGCVFLIPRGERKITQQRLLLIREQTGSFLAPLSVAAGWLMQTYFLIDLVKGALYHTKTAEWSVLFNFYNQRIPSWLINKQRSGSSAANLFHFANTRQYNSSNSIFSSASVVFKLANASY